mgnify:CR=1 FL=1
MCFFKRESRKRAIFSCEKLNFEDKSIDFEQRKGGDKLRYLMNIIQKWIKA